MKACHFLMLPDWFEEMIRNWQQLVCTSFRIKWVNSTNVVIKPKHDQATQLPQTIPSQFITPVFICKTQICCYMTKLRGRPQSLCRLTPMTSLAPAFAANMLRMPVPHPTSRTTLPLNRCLL